MSDNGKPSHNGITRILICPNAFKGSLTAAEAARAIAEGIARAVAPGQSASFTPSEQHGSKPIETICLPLADGGDGTLQTLVEATGGTLHPLVVRGPLGDSVQAAWGRLGGEKSDTAIIEMARASGLCLLNPQQYDPYRASTYGTGELMRAALDAGCTTLLVGIGGSATNDGGAGMAQALGAHLLDAEGRELEPGGLALQRLACIEAECPLLPVGVTVYVACDVDNPLYGPEGAAAIYGPQKGATLEMVRELDTALRHYAAQLEQWSGKAVARVPGAGAAGGLGAGLMAFCGATLQPGTEMVLDATDFDGKLQGCRLVITGEGRLDGQTARGKLVAGVARRAQAAGVPVIALAGGVAPGAEELLREVGLTAAMSLLEAPCTVEEAMQDGYRLLGHCAERVARLLCLQW